MRLLDVDSFEFSNFEGSNVPRYAILSHRWEAGEVTYEDMKEGLEHSKKKAGFDKIRQCCARAYEDGLYWVWIDTCCIEKSSSAELTEAINSMYRWYRNSALCYAYLSDVELWRYDNFELRDSLSENFRTAAKKTEIWSSKWWTRGWTLQELLAPREVRFFAAGQPTWQPIGDKISLIDLISSRTRINKDVLQGLDIDRCSIAMRMSWVSDRETTRVEDLAYCLLGVFSVNMPLLYGEGERAFIRLQEEIMKQSDDQTLFAWQLSSRDSRAEICGPLATSPSLFRGCSDMVPVSDSGPPAPYSMTNKGLRIELPLVQIESQQRSVAILQCSTRQTFPRRMVLPILQVNQDEHSHFARDGRYTFPLRSVERNELASAVPRTIFMRQEPWQNYQWKTKVLINVQEDLYLHGGLVFFDSRQSTFFDHSSCAIWNKYYSPTNCTKGAVIIMGPTVDIIVLFNIELQQYERLSCKVLLVAQREQDVEPERALELTSVSHAKTVVSLLSKESDDEFKSSPARLFGSRTPASEKSRPRRSEIEQLLNLEKLYTNISASTNSFVELKDGRAVRATIGAQLFGGQSTRVLNIELIKWTEGEWPLHELPASKSHQA